MISSTLHSTLRIERTIAEGGMGLTLLARDVELDRHVVVKTLRPDLLANESMRARFVREVRILRDLHHQNIVRVLSCDLGAESPWFSMEYLPGGDLTAIPESRSFQVLLQHFVEICAAVEYAHGRHVVHRDIKPSNILIAADGHARLTDFGLGFHSSRETTALTSTAVGMGTMGFAAPEQLADAKAATPAADVYSLCVTLYYLLYGVFPFASKRRPPILWQGVPNVQEDRLSETFARGLVLDPTVRLSIYDLRSTLEALRSSPQQAKDRDSQEQLLALISELVRLRTAIPQSALQVLHDLADGKTVEASSEYAGGGRDDPEIYETKGPWADIKWLVDNKLATALQELTDKYEEPEDSYLTDVAIADLGRALLHFLRQLPRSE